MSETWVRDDALATHRKPDAEPAQVRTILEKIQLILRHFDALNGRC